MRRNVRNERNGRNATDVRVTDGTDTTTASVYAFLMLHQLLLLRVKDFLNIRYTLYLLTYLLAYFSCVHCVSYVLFCVRCVRCARWKLCLIRIARNAKMFCKCFRYHTLSSSSAPSCRDALDVTTL